MVIEAPYTWPNPYDDFLPKIVEASKKDMEDNEDDRLFIFVGPTRTGKSMLAFHTLNLYTDDVSMDFVAIDRAKFATVPKKVKEAKNSGVKLRYGWMDEMDADNQEQNSKWNKELFKLFMKIGYLGGFWLWCWPSLKKMDRTFVEERINGIFFCFTKDKVKPRKYAYFPKTSILHMIDDNIILNHHNLKKAIEKHAAWIGKFRDYNGKGKKEYLEMKYSSGDDAVDNFNNLFGDKDDVVEAKVGYSRADLRHKSGLSKGKFDYWFDEGRRTGDITGKGVFSDEELQWILSKTQKAVVIIPKYVKNDPHGAADDGPAGHPLKNARGKK